MYTQCPHCQTCFRIAEAHLKAAKGQVRCGSCKEIFDATEQLYDGVPTADSKPAKNPVAKPPAAKPAISPTPAAIPPPPRYNEILPSTIDIPEQDHQHIDLSTPPDRTNAPDQSQFMESLVGDNSRYNNLDDMGSINIPGESDFSNSFIKFASDKRDQPEVVKELASVPDSKPINQYTDTDALESPATTQEQDGIDALYSAADNQLHQSEPDPQQIDKDIEALLGGDLAFDDDIQPEPPEKPKNTNSPLPQAEEPQLVPKDDEIELPPAANVVKSKDIWAKTDGPTKRPQDKPETDDILDQHDQQDDTSIENKIEFSEFDDFLKADDIAPTIDTDIDNPEFDASKFNSPEIKKPEIKKPEIKKREAKPSKPKPAIKKREAETRAKSEAKVKIEDDLPSPDHDIPKALRSSFENFEPPLRPIGLTMVMGAAIVVLVVGILGQSVLFRSYQLARLLPSLTPILTSLCSTLPCRYSGSIDVTKIEVLNRDMRSHPSQKNALLVSTAIVNNAPFDQPYPIIAVKLFDLSGQTVATRYFKPKEYLENLYSKFLLMESGTPVHITLAVLDPGDDAINFEISFL